jgi:hypothetical protein
MGYLKLHLKTTVLTSAITIAVIAVVLALVNPASLLSSARNSGSVLSYRR